MNNDLSFSDLELIDDNDGDMKVFETLDNNSGVLVKKSFKQRCITDRLKGIVEFKDRLFEVLGWRFIIFLLCSQMFGKGLLSAVVESVMLPLFKTVVKVDAAQLQIYVMIVMSPWSIKPLIGLCSDTILIYGYNKRGWLCVGLIFGIVSSSLLFITRGNAIFLVLCFTGINMQIALFDLLSEGKYSEIRRNNPTIGSDISVLVQAMQSIGAIAAALFVGTLADGGLYFVLFGIAVVLCVSPTGPVLLGWLPEVRYVNAKCVQFIHTQILKKERLPIMVVAFCGIGGIITSVVTTVATPITGLITSGVLLLICLLGSWIAFPAGITSVVFYQVIINLSQPVIGSANDYFYTAGPDCLLNGPNFSFTYYVTITKTIGSICTFVGVVVYGFLFSKLRYRAALIITTILSSLAGLSDVFIITRTNIRIGIPDKAAYIFGESIVEPILGMLQWIPINGLISLSVKDGMEASSYAFVAGISNFSRMISELNGSIIFSASGINTTPGQCDFTALPWLNLVCHILMPLSIGICATFLLPNIKQDENL